MQCNGYWISLHMLSIWWVKWAKEKVATARSNISMLFFVLRLSYIWFVYQWYLSSEVTIIQFVSWQASTLNYRTNWISFSFSKSIYREIWEWKSDACRKYVLKQLKINKKFIELDNSMWIHTTKTNTNITHFVSNCMRGCVVLCCIALHWHKRTRGITWRKGQ